MQAATFGLSADRAKLYEAALEGASHAELVQAAAIVTNLEMMESWSRQSKEATTARQQLNDTANELVRGLQEEVAFFGLSAEWAKIAKLQYDGASQAVIKQAMVLQHQVDALEKAKDAQKELAEEAKKTAEKSKRAAEEMKEAWQDFAKGIRKDTDPPLGDLIAQLRDLDIALQAKLITQEQHDLAGMKAADEFRDAMDMGDSRPQALIRGSADAYSAITRPQEKGIKELVQIARQQLELDRQRAGEVRLELAEAEIF